MDVDEEEGLRAFGGLGRRGMAQEDTSMKKIKNVQGVEGRWTVTDCDADRKGERHVLLTFVAKWVDQVQDDLFVHHSLCSHAVHYRGRYRAC